jgi:hypothetical protein
MFVASLVSGPVGAQSTQTTQTTQTTRTQSGDVIGPHNPYCGAWVDGAFQANGNCLTETTTTTTTTQPAAATVAGSAVVGAAPNARVNQRVSGKIIAVNGSMVTLRNGDRTLIVNDSRALSREDTGRVATGRDIIAHGYWEDGTFYASSFQ